MARSVEALIDEIDRYILVWPHLFFAFFYSIAFYVVWILSWFVLVFTARWPDSLYRFTGGFLRYITRVTAYFYLGVDRYPHSAARMMSRSRTH
jgi:hypothetical protein